MLQMSWIERVLTTDDVVIQKAKETRRLIKTLQS